MTLNLLLALYDVSTGKLTPGDFVLVQALFMQLANPLHNVGTLFREVDQSTVDVEDLYKLLKSSPYVKEKPNAEEFEFDKGKIKFENIKFKHLANDMEKEEKTLYEDFNLEI